MRLKLCLTLQLERLSMPSRVLQTDIPRTARNVLNLLLSVVRIQAKVFGTSGPWLRAVPSTACAVLRAVARFLELNQTRSGRFPCRGTVPHLLQTYGFLYGLFSRHTCPFPCHDRALCLPFRVFRVRQTSLCEDVLFKRPSLSTPFIPSPRTLPRSLSAALPPFRWDWNFGIINNLLNR